MSTLSLNVPPVPPAQVHVRHLAHAPSQVAATKVLYEKGPQETQIYIKGNAEQCCAGSTHRYQVWVPYPYPVLPGTT
jgi:hypothetical protein